MKGKSKILLFHLVLLCGSITAQNVDSTYYTIAFSDNSFHDVDEDDARAIVNVIGKKLVAEYDEFAEGGSIVFNAKSELQSSIDSGVDMFILLATEYIESWDNESLIPVYSIVVDGKIGFKYHLIVNNNSSIYSVADLQNKSISLLANNNESPTYYWLSSVLKNSSLSPPNNFFSQIQLKPKAKNIILSVFFNKLDACITTSNSLDIAAELNPQLKAELRIIETSPSILTGVICLNKSILGSKKEVVLLRALKSLHSNHYGKQLLDLYGIDHLVPYEETHIKTITDIMERLKNNGY